MTETAQLANDSMEFRIFSALFKTDDTLIRRRSEFLNTFSDFNMFKNEFFVYATMVKEYSKIHFTGDFISVFMQTNRALFSRSRNVDFSSFSFSDEDPYVQFMHSCVGIFMEAQRREFTVDEYFRDLAMFKMLYVNQQTISVLEESAIILTEGVTFGNRSLKGYADMRKNLQQKLVNIDNIVNKTDRKGVITYDKMDDDEQENSGKLHMVARFNIDGMDKAMGGVFEGDMVSLLAPAKGCKSRFATYVLHDAIVNVGTSIVMWSVENGYKGWEALIRARHFNWLYNQHLTDATQKRLIDSDMIRKGALEGDLAEMELASWNDLRFNPNYGKFANIDRDFDIDDFLEIIEEAIDTVGAKLICIDYLQLIGGKNSSMTKNERISRAYIEMLQFVKRKKVGGIFPAQLKQSSVSDIGKQKPDQLINMELRDAAGESYEVIKTPDVNLVLYGTVEDIKNGSMKMISVPSRNSAPFEPIDLFVDAGTCTFHDVTGQNGFDGSGQAA